VNVTGLVAGLGVGGLAVALAAQKSLENLFGGLTLIVDQRGQRRRVQGAADGLSLPVQELRYLVAKMSHIQRQQKREKLVAKFAKKYAELKAVSNDAKRSDEERYMARLELQKLPRNANPTRLRNRCELTGRPRGTFRMFGLGRSKIRDLAFKGDIPGVVKASW
jgi:small subunit ribosomal protein S14